MLETVDATVNYWSQVIPALFAILGVIIAGTINYFVTKQIYIKQIEEKKKTLEQSIFIEMQNIIETLELRGYLNLMKSMVVKEPPQSLQVEISANYDIIYRMNCQNIGLLSPKTAVDVVKFYHLVESVALDFKGGICLKGSEDYNTLKQDIDFIGQAIKIAARYSVDKN